MPDRDLTKPTSEEISAYLDRALPAVDVARVEAYLASHPEEASRVDTYRLQEARMRAVFSPPSPEDPPEALQALAGTLVRKVQRHRRIRTTARYASVVALCVVAAAAGRFSADYPGPTDSTVVAQSRYAADAFRLVTNHPGASGLDQSATAAALGEWLSHDGDAEKVRIPRLQLLGFTLVGGQVLPTGAGPAVQLVYNDEKKGPFSLYVARAPECGRTTPRFTQDSDVSLLSWCKDRVVYMLIGRLDRDSMRWIMDAVAHPDPRDGEVQHEIRQQDAPGSTAVGEPESEQARDADRPKIQPAVVRGSSGN